MVLSEICRKPSNSKVTEEEQLELLAVWQESSEHPLSDIVTEAGKAVILGLDVGTVKYTEMISQLIPYKGEYCALSILTFSCHDFDYADKFYEKVIKEWNA